MRIEHLAQPFVTLQAHQVLPVCISEASNGVASGTFNTSVGGATYWRWMCKLTRVFAEVMSFLPVAAHFSLHAPHCLHTATAAPSPPDTAIPGNTRYCPKKARVLG